LNSKSYLIRYSNINNGTANYSVDFNAIDQVVFADNITEAKMDLINYDDWTNCLVVVKEPTPGIRYTVDGNMYGEHYNDVCRVMDDSFDKGAIVVGLFRRDDYKNLKKFFWEKKGWDWPKDEAANKGQSQENSANKEQLQEKSAEKQKSQEKTTKTEEKLPDSNEIKQETLDQQKIDIAAKKRRISDLTGAINNIINKKIEI